MEHRNTESTNARKRAFLRLSGGASDSAYCELELLVVKGAVVQRIDVVMERADDRIDMLGSCGRIRDERATVVIRETKRTHVVDELARTSKVALQTGCGTAPENLGGKYGRSLAGVAARWRPDPDGNENRIVVGLFNSLSVRNG